MRTTLFSLILVVVLMFSCKSDKTDTLEGEKPLHANPISDTTLKYLPKDFTDVKWKFESLYINSRPLPIDNDSDLNISFVGNKVIGKGQCNTFTATWSMNGEGRISIKDHNRDAIRCPASKAGKESRFFRIIENAATFTLMSKDSLVINSQTLGTLLFLRE